MIDAKVFDSTGSVVTSSLVDNNDGTYSVKAKLTKVGTYSTSVEYNGAPVMGSPVASAFEVTVGPIDLIQSTFETGGLKSTLNALTNADCRSDVVLDPPCSSINVIVRDSFGNAPSNGGVLKVTFQYSNGTSLLLPENYFSQSWKADSGSWLVKFAFPEGGFYKMDVQAATTATGIPHNIGKTIDLAADVRNSYELLYLFS